jgi:hypothetical protein
LGLTSRFINFSTLSVSDFFFARSPDGFGRTLTGLFENSNEIR